MGEFLKKPEYRKFNLTPRYWDPKKEAREAREKRVKAELGILDDNEQYVPNIQGQFRREYNTRANARANTGAGSGRTIRLFMILVLLFLGAFYLFIKNPEGLLKLFGL